MISMSMLLQIFQILHLTMYSSTNGGLQKQINQLVQQAFLWFSPWLFFKYIYSQMRPQQKTNAWSFFSCCDQPQPKDSGLRPNYPITRPDFKRIKYTHTMISPKASLRSLKIQRAHPKHLYQSSLPSQTSLHATCSPPSSAPTKLLQRDQKTQRFLNPKQTHTHKPSLDFQTVRVQLSAQVVSPAQDSERISKATHFTQTSTINDKSECDRTSLCGGGESRLYSSIQLGGSRKTVVSKMEQSREPTVRIEQSSIMVNVFNPSQSEVGRWAINRSSNLGSITHINSWSSNLGSITHINSGTAI